MFFVFKNKVYVPLLSPSSSAVSDNCILVNFYQTRAEDPLVIVGFPRSGTTMLHRLLESGKQFVTPMFWEMMEPLPPGRVVDFRNSQRYLKAKADFGEFTILRSYVCYTVLIETFLPSI